MSIRLFSRRRLIVLTFCLCASASFTLVSGQVPAAISAEILQFEDQRFFSDRLIQLLRDNNPDVRRRAALAAGRIGDADANAALFQLLENEKIESVREMAAFAIGEIESAAAAGQLIEMLRLEAKNGRATSRVGRRLIESAGKIVAANPKAKKAAELGVVILDSARVALSDSSADTEAIVLILTALLRARPAGSDEVAAGFLNHPNPRVRADAANVLARIRAKNAVGQLTKLLESDSDAVVRANAARALGAAGDRVAEAALVTAALGDTDLRVRVSAIRSLGMLNAKGSAEKLVERGEKLLQDLRTSKFRLPAERNELLEIFPVLGKLLYNTWDERAADLTEAFAKLDNFENPEAVVARFRIVRGRGTGYPAPKTFRQYATAAEVIGEYSDVDPTNDVDATRKAEAPDRSRDLALAFIQADPEKEPELFKAGPTVLRAFARFKTEDLPGILRRALESKDVFIRATAAELLADLPASPENLAALRKAYAFSTKFDRDSDDAVIAILDTLQKSYSQSAIDIFRDALESPNYIVRRKAFQILEDTDFGPFSEEAVRIVEAAKMRGVLRVYPHKPVDGTRLGQVLNTKADYLRAVQRRNGTIRAEVKTEKGNFTIELFPEDAPLTVENFVKLASRGFFNGKEIHRVVPNFVVQDGDPRGDGNGGPGWSIRCEINMIPYERGTVGMALSGKDTGGSQWFVTHSPQPHLDGGYTVFGRVDESGMKVVDTLVRGDKIISIIIRYSAPKSSRNR